MLKKIYNFVFISILFLTVNSKAQINFDGNFLVRWYSDNFKETMDDHGNENFIRYLGQFRVNAKATKNISFHTEVVTLSDNPVNAARNLGGTGTMKFGISKIYADLVEPNFLGLDVMRIRVGRQQFPIGEGLSQGESYYYYDKFDGGRVDLSYKFLSLSLFGAITGQNLSESGIYPEPGSDQLYIARLGANLLNQDCMIYFIQNKLRGDYNDSYIYGVGTKGAFLENKLEYFWEFAHQKFNPAPGLPKSWGNGYMFGLSYTFNFAFFKSIKVESKYAAYEGDDANSSAREMFSPLYPSFFWGDRRGYVNGSIGGQYPYAGRNLEGSRIWYSRLWFILKELPKLRVQFQYVKMNEYIDNDNYNSFDDEFSIRLYYTFIKNTLIQFRYTKTIPNGNDFDVNNSGAISSSEDRAFIDRFMFEFRVEF